LREIGNKAADDAVRVVAFVEVIAAKFRLIVEQGFRVGVGGEDIKLSDQDLFCHCFCHSLPRSSMPSAEDAFEVR
jgi:hypothetical protein